MLGDGILLRLALLNDVKCPVTIDLFPLVASIGKEHRHNCVNHYQIEPFGIQALGTGLALCPRIPPILRCGSLSVSRRKRGIKKRFIVFSF